MALCKHVLRKLNADSLMRRRGVLTIGLVKDAVVNLQARAGEGHLRGHGHSDGAGQQVDPLSVRL